MQPYGFKAITPLHGPLYRENKQYPSTPQIRAGDKQGVVEGGDDAAAMVTAFKRTCYRSKSTRCHKEEEEEEVWGWRHK